MESKRLLLGAASILALTATTSPSSAALNDGVPALGPSHHTPRAVGSGDAIIEFIVGTGGLISIETVDAGLARAFKSMSVANTAEIPRFLRDLIALGISPDVREAVEAGLADIVASSELPDDDKAALSRMLAERADGYPSQYQLAQAMPNRRPPPSDGAVGRSYN